MDKKICCVNDMPGVGKVALAAMIPLLSSKGISVSCLPTALVSNTLDFGKFEIMDTSDYMNKTVDVWKELGFQFDCIATGFMINPEQIHIVEKLIDNQNNPDLLVVVDPIMGDGGKLYNGVSDTNVKIMRELAAKADLLIPNYTEACFLVDDYYDVDNLDFEQAQALIEKCRGLGAKSIVITSSKIQERNCVIGYDHLKDAFFTIDFEMIDAQFPGTGDIFSAVLIAEKLKGVCLHDATLKAMNVVSEIIKANKDKTEKIYGVDIEKYLEEGNL